MLLLFSYVSYLISPSSNTSFLTNYPLVSFFLYPIFLFFILKHILYICCQIRLNPPYPIQKYTIYACHLQENIDLNNLKSALRSKILKDERFKVLKRSIKSNFFISYSCPAQKFIIEDHLELIEEPFEKDIALSQFLELNLMGLFETTNDNEPKWRIFLIKNWEKKPILVFKFLSEYVFSSDLLLELLEDNKFKIKKSTTRGKEIQGEWNFSKNLRIMKRIMDIKTKNPENNSSLIVLLKGIFKGGNERYLMRKQVFITDADIKNKFENNKFLRDDKNFLNEKEVNFMFDLFKLAGLFIPNALMIQAFGLLEKKYQRMGYLNNIIFRKEIPGVIKKMFVINWKEQMFSISLSEQTYGELNSLVLIQNENLKKRVN